MSMIPIAKVVFCYLLRAANTLGHILPRHLDVNATGVGTQRRMHLEKPFHFIKNPIERTRLIPR